MPHFLSIKLTRGVRSALQSRKIGPVVDVVGTAVQHQGRNRFDARRFGFGQARLVIAQVDDFDIEPDRVQGRRHTLFRRHTHRAEVTEFLSFRIFLCELCVPV